MYLRFPGGKTKALTLSYDDGVEQDKRLIEIMNRHGLKGTFNINSGQFAEEGTVYPKGQVHRRMTKKEAAALYQQSGQEVALHTLTHPHLEALPQPNVMREVLEDRSNLEALFQTVIRGMAYPFGTYNDETLEVLKNAGIAYSRTTVSTERFDLPKDWLRLPATCHHRNPRLMELWEEFLGKEPNTDGWMFYLWGHSYEFEGNDNWEVIERFAQRAGGHDTVWYATNIEIYDYVQTYKRLRFNLAESIVENLSAQDVWFVSHGETLCVKGGETLHF